MRLLVTLLTLLLLSSCNFKHQEADVIFHNAVIVDCDGVGQERAEAKAIAVKDGRIVDIGAEHSIRNAYRTKELVDLKQAVVYPGFIDAHAHFLGYALTKLEVDLVGTESFEQVLERAKAFHEAQTKEARETTWLSGRGWDQNDWDVQEYPTREELDSLFPERPVAIRRVDGHAVLANKVALEAAGMLDTLYIEGGEIVINEDGELTGVLVDAAADYLLSFKPEYDETVKRQALIDAEKDVFAAGLTSVVDAGLDVGDIRLINEMHESGDLKIRVVAMSSGTESNIDSALAMGPWRTDRLIAESIKFYMDGALGSRGAALLEAYTDRPGHTGYLIQDSAKYHNWLEQAYERGFQACTHGIGDRAVRTVLEHYAEILGGVNDRRWRVEHSQVVHSDDIELFAQSSVIPSVQPTHATSDMYWAAERLGRGRIRRAYIYKDLQNILGILPLGTDFPIEGISPISTFYAATVRKDASGYPAEGFNIDQALDRNSALLGITVWASIANNNDSEVGSIEKGKWADFTILDRNILTVDANQILETKVLRTVVAGQTTHLWEN